MERIAGALCGGDDHRKRFTEILLDRRFLPAGRVQSSIGSQKERLGVFTVSRITTECLGCGILMENVHHNRKRCGLCARDRKNEQEREKWLNDSEYRKKRNEAVRELQRKRRATDPEYVENGRKASLARYHSKYKKDPEYVENHRRRSRERTRNLYANDPGWVETQNARCLAIHRRKRTAMVNFLRWLRGPDCSVCGAALPEMDDRVEIDHRLARENWPEYMPKGSVHAVSNLQLLHSRCNRSKKSRIQMKDRRAV